MTPIAPILLMLYASLGSIATTQDFKAVISKPKTVTLSWSFPQSLETPDLIFKAYHSTDIAKPLSQWTVYVTVPGGARSAALPIVEKQEFFMLTASNYLGESGFATQ